MKVNIIPSEDTTKDPGEVYEQFNSRSDKLLYKFYENEYILVSKENRELKMEELRTIIHRFFGRIITNENIDKGYKKASIYNRYARYNRGINDFRTGNKIIRTKLREENIFELMALKDFLNTSASNILRLCVFESLDIQCYNNENIDDGTRYLYSIMFTEYKVVMQQIREILEMKEEKYEDAIRVHDIEYF